MVIAVNKSVKAGINVAVNIGHGKIGISERNEFRIRQNIEIAVYINPYTEKISSIRSIEYIGDIY